MDLLNSSPSLNNDSFMEDSFYSGSIPEDDMESSTSRADSSQLKLHNYPEASVDSCSIPEDDDMESSTSDEDFFQLRQRRHHLLLSDDEEQ